MVVGTNVLRALCSHQGSEVGDRRSLSLQPGECDRRQNSMKVRAGSWLPVLVIVGALTACASRSTDAGTAASDRSGVVSTAAADGTVTGVARLYGGPPLLNGHMAADGNPYFGLPLTATQNGQPIASTVTGSDGGYRFTLAPGSYVITGCADAAVVVVAGQIARQDITCPVP